MKHFLSKVAFFCLFLGSVGALSAQPAQLQVMSYNIRYDNPGDAPNHWDNRKDKVANLLQFYNPAFIGTQEALFHQLDYLDQSLPQYNWIGQGRDDGKKEGEFSALMYNTNAVQLVANSDSTIWLSKTPDMPSKNWDAALPRILTWGEFKIKSNGKHIFVFNTHFDHRGEQARAESAKIILRTIQKIAGNLPVVLTGDFNIIDTSKPYQILTSTFLADAINTSQLPHVGAEFTYSGFGVRAPDDGRRIDYIFTNSKVDVLKHAIITSFQDGYFPSDHLPVLAEISLK
ncbi:endonuclease/exonuclease/phosphatase family protein [Fodinibius salsisoli]|uniref:Endonuclease/exonuclease/phosphatase family protein n=1 Tax=Fodinibius salsisoli TaxID=2820877 RepID=A0ABT3PKP6_9BACT|nr:endonuclease/exonuclease/phosphatase family protein [Fodinibius salsisoli]MCW9706519.1 endonuclease/exonuclease/phosphatase family protein [Fodinibius salsisoli]